MIPTDPVGHVVGTSAKWDSAAAGQLSWSPEQAAAAFSEVFQPLRRTYARRRTLEQLRFGYSLSSVAA